VFNHERISLWINVDYDQTIISVLSLVEVTEKAVENATVVYTRTLNYSLPHPH